MAKDENWVMARKNRNHGLEPLRQVLALANHPEQQLRIVHITGTNGKGSTTNYLKDILVSQGYRVGMFTSPFLETHFDRIRINDTWISKETFQTYLDHFLPWIEAYDLSMFEIDFLIAMAWFAEQNVSYALVECGLGARRDMTAVIDHPVLSVITTVNFDHMQIMGNRIQQITFEKAGIMKEHVPVVMGNIQEQASVILRKEAQKKRCPYQFVHYRNVGPACFEMDGETYSLCTLAQYQKQNASLALLCAKYLGMDIHRQEVKEAILQSQWKGRFETIGQNPTILVDGAHNEEGIDALVETLRGVPHPVLVVFSALKDKPARRMAAKLKSVSQTMIVTHFENARSDTMENLSMEGTIAIADYREAIQYAKKIAPEDAWIVISGSLYFVSLAREYVLQEGNL